MTTLLPAAAVIRFTVNGGEVEADVEGGRRLLDVLRTDLGLSGTKEGCSEGECGACAVLVDGELVNSCLVPVGQVAGRDVRTVEGLAEEGRLGPLQQAFLELGGTQCGMCAPGMLLAAHAVLAAGRPTGVADIREAIAGNLCRCTGYTKIIDAVEAVAGDGTPWAERGTGRGPAARIVVAAPAGAGGGARLVHPSSLPDAVARLAADPRLRPVAGGTDLMVAEHGASPVPGARRPLLDLGGLDELRGIALSHDELVMGSMTTWEELRRSPIVHGALPVLAEIAATMGAVAIRNRGTLGGNCVTASPAGDLLPVLLAIDAKLEAVGPRGTRFVPACAFWTGYRRTALAPDELLAAIRIPLVPERQVRFRKVGTRRALAIAKVLVAVAWQPADDPPGAWRDVHVALGSVAERPVRAQRTEAVLEGRVPGLETGAAAAAAVEAEITPIDDIRSTAAYRRAVTGRVLRRIVLDAAG
jgi:carbon-monoxide dehydrogenase small subunit/xanthine dehydrogenase small subunit